MTSSRSASRDVPPFSESVTILGDVVEITLLEQSELVTCHYHYDKAHWEEEDVSTVWKLDADVATPSQCSWLFLTTTVFHLHWVAASKVATRLCRRTKPKGTTISLSQRKDRAPKDATEIQEDTKIQI